MADKKSSGAGTSQTTGFLTPWPAITVDKDAVFVKSFEYPQVAQLPSFSIRNGDPSDAKSLLIRATIPTAYHWVPVSGVSPSIAVACIEGYIKSHIDHLEKNPPANSNTNLRRKMAICLGVARAVATEMYEVAQADLIPGEMADPVLMMAMNKDGEPTYAPRADLDAASKTRLAEPLTLTAQEKAVISVLITSAAGIIPLQGYSLMMTQHHYLSAENTQSRKAFAAVEKQHWRGADLGEWFSSDLATVQDTLWHKACHPVSISLKEVCATDSRVAVMVANAGAGAAAARLPACEPEMRAAGSVRNLLGTCANLLETCGGSVEYSILQVAMDALRTFPINNDNPPRPEGLPAVVPASVTNRTSARSWLADILARNSDKTAFCFGFYCAISDGNQTLGGATGGDTLRTSYSLNKLKTQSYAAYVSGQQFHRDYEAARAKARETGSFLVPNVKFA